MLKKYDLPVTLGQENSDGTIWIHEMVSNYLGGTDHVDPTDYWSESANDYFGSDYDVERFCRTSPSILTTHYKMCKLVPFLF